MPKLASSAEIRPLGTNQLKKEVERTVSGTGLFDENGGQSASGRGGHGAALVRATAGCSLAAVHERPRGGALDTWQRSRLQPRLETLRAHRQRAAPHEPDRRGHNRSASARRAHPHPHRLPPWGLAPHARSNSPPALTGAGLRTRRTNATARRRRRSLAQGCDGEARPVIDWGAGSDVNWGLVCALSTA